LRKAVIIRGKRRHEDVPEKCILDRPALLFRKFVVKPIISERDRDRDLGAI
jgi:hypothetical protein